MMKLAMIMIGASLGACSAAGGAPVDGPKQNRSFAERDFTGVELRGSDDVTVQVGGAYSVRAEGPQAVLDRLQIERVGSALRIGRKPMSGWNWGSAPGAHITVTMPAIAEANVAGSGEISIDRVDGDVFAAANAGSGAVRVGAVRVRQANFSIAGSGTISAAGSAERLTLSIAGSGSVEARGLKAASAEVSIMGSGDATAEVNGPAAVSIAGSGDVDLGPNAKCQVSKLGSGEARCGK